MLKSTKLKIPAGNFLLDSQVMSKSLKVKNPAESFHHDEPHVVGRERHLVDNHGDVAIMQAFFAKVGLSRERSRKCARKAVIRDIITPQRLYYYFKSVPEFSLLSLGMDKFDADMVEEDLHMEFEIAYKSNTTEQLEIEPQVAPMKGHQQETEEQLKTAHTRERSRKSITDLHRKYAIGSKSHPDDEDNILDMQEFFRFAGLSVRTSRSCAEEAISLTATSPKKLYKYVQSKRITLEELGMDPVDVEMVMEALWQAFPSYRKRFAGRLKVRRMDDNSYAEDDSYFDGPDSSNEFKSDGSEDMTRMDDRSTSSRSPSTTTDKSSNRRRRSSHTSDVRISDYTLQQQQIHLTTSNVRLTQWEIEEERERQQQLLIARNRPHSYYPSSYFNSLTYIEGDGPHDSHMLKLHSNGAEDGILNPFHSSAHSMGVSHALASLPSRPSSAHRPTNGVTVHTEMLLMRVASILKTKYGQ